MRGDVRIRQDGLRTIIRASDGSIIRYSGFDIGPNERVRFIQPGAAARVLNRIGGPTPTVIEGRLLANGRVYLVNPAGVIFGPGAVVNAGALYAAAGRLSNGDYIAGLDHFTRLSGTVTNEGLIGADTVALFGRRVANSGMISAPRGAVIMAAGRDVLVKPHGERIMLRIDGHDPSRGTPPVGSTAPDMAADPGVVNEGTISAAHGSVMLGAGDGFGFAIANQGAIGGAGADVRLAASDGLIANDGAIDVSVPRGRAGSISLRAPSVLNRGAIRADAETGRAGAIDVLAGEHAFLTETSLVSAAGGAGEARGGRVIIDSPTGRTAVAGGALLDVSGGALGGRGGFVEVSGGQLLFNGDAWLGAASGWRAGTLLLDPGDIVINTIGGDDSFLDDAVITFDEGTLQDTFIAASTFSDIEGFIHLQAQGFIFVDAPIVLEHGNDLLFEANHAVSIRHPIIGARSFTARADVDGNGYGWVSLNVPMSFAGDVDFSGTDILLSGGELVAGGSAAFHGHIHVGALTGENRIEAASILMDGPVDSKFFLAPRPDQALRIDGPVTFTAPVGAVSPLHSLLVDGPAELGAGAVITRRSQRWLGPITLTAGSTLSSLEAGRITFDGAIDGGHALRVETAGVTRFAGTAGAVEEPAAIITDAPGETWIAADLAADRLAFGDRVVLRGDVELRAAESVDFAAMIQGGGHDLTVIAPLTRFGGDALGLGVLRTDAAGLTLIGADVGGETIHFGDAVELLGDSVVDGAFLVRFDGTIDGPHALTAISGGSVHFGNDVGGGVALAALETRTGGIVLIDGNLLRATGDVRLNPGGRTGVPNVATIAGRGGDLTIESQQGDVLVGQNEKITALGDLTVGAAGSVTLGDLNSLGDLRVLAEEIRLRTRPGAELLDFRGATIADGGTDVVAGGTIIFSSAPIVLGDGARPIFGSGAGAGPGLGGFELRATPGLLASHFTFGATVLDLTPRAGGGGGGGGGGTDLAEALPARIAAIDDPVIRRPWALRPLQQLGLYLRTPRPAELRRSVEGRQIHDNMALSGRGAPATSTARLRRPALLAVVDRYAGLFGAEPGDAPAVADARREQIRTELADAWAAYASADAGADSAGFRAFLEQSEDPAHAQALAHVNALRAMFHELWLMGATSRELASARSAVLGPMNLPEGVLASM